MEQNLFSRLPPEIATSILSRLSVRGVARSKCVCKPWLDLLCSDDFVNSYRSKSAALAVLTLEKESNWCKFFEIGDELGNPEGYNPIAKFDFPRRTRAIGGSVNGLLLLHHRVANVDASYVCNPITREFVEIHFDFHEERQYGRPVVAYGFGASNVSGEYKLVRIDSGSGHCHVYTLGTRRWRRVGAAGAAASLRFGCVCCYGAFLNGNLYWSVLLICDPECETLIAWFDLEKECLGTFECPPIRVYGSNVELFTFRDCLSFWDETNDNEIVIWVMKECGIEKSWRKEYVINHPPGFGLDGAEFFQTIKAFENGDILVLYDERTFFCYSIKTKTYKEIPSFGVRGHGDYRFIHSLLLTPSFRSLKSFGMEDVISF